MLTGYCPKHEQTQFMSFQIQNNIAILFPLNSNAAIIRISCSIKYLKFEQRSRLSSNWPSFKWLAPFNYDFYTPSTKVENGMLT